MNEKALMMDIAQANLNEMVRGCAFSVTQGWCGNVLVIHTMTSFTQGYWTLGVPTPDQALYVTDQWDDALAHLIDLTTPVDSPKGEESLVLA